MDDLISRRMAIDAIDKILPVNPMKTEYTQGITCGAALAMEYVKQLPAADVQKVKHGKWEKITFITGEINTCSLCGFGKSGYDDRAYNYCPNCGAKMEVKNE